MSKIKTITSICLALTLGASEAWAGLCQVQSPSFFVTQFCGPTFRGFGQGSSMFGARLLIANSTGTPGGSSSVGAVGVASDGSLLHGCKPLDTTEDGVPEGVLGGQCNSAVKFWVQVNY